MLITVDIPGSVTSIGNNVFGRCTSLASTSIPDGVTSIGESTFSGCTSLATVVIGSGVTSIGDGAFRDCSALSSIDIPAGVTAIGNYAFSGCKSLVTMDLPAGLTGIGDYAFSGCFSLTSISIPEGVTSIGNGAFDTCLHLASVICRAENVPQLGSNVFKYVPLTKVTLYVPFSALEAYKAAYYWRDFGKILSINDISTFEVDGIWYNVNDDRKSVTVTYKELYYPSYSGGIVIPSAVTYDGQTYRVTGIGELAFYNCSSLVSVSLPESLTGIGDWAFGDCTSFTSIDIPGCVTSIGNYAFSGCPSLATMTVSADNPVFDSREGCNAIILSSTNTLIAGCRNTIISSSVTGIGDAAFLNCTSLTGIDIPASVTNIGEDVFSGCPSLTSMTVSPDNPVFDSREGCNAIIWTSINSLMAGCQNTVIPSSVTRIGENAFCDCTSLTSIDIPDGVTSIGGNAFYGCTSLASIKLPSGLTRIEGYAFCRCTSLTSIDIPSGVTIIGWYTFRGCETLATIVCRAAKLPQLGNDVFASVPQGEVTLYVPSSSVEAYKAADQWKNFGKIVSLEDYETGIDIPAPTKENNALTAPYYTTAGQRVAAPARGGIYIRGGRKVIY